MSERKPRHRFARGHTAHLLSSRTRFRHGGMPTMTFLRGFEQEVRARGADAITELRERDPATYLLACVALVYRLRRRKGGAAER